MLAHSRRYRLRLILGFAFPFHLIRFTRRIGTGSAFAMVRLCHGFDVLGVLTVRLIVMDCKIKTDQTKEKPLIGAWLVTVRVYLANR